MGRRDAAAGGNRRRRAVAGRRGVHWRADRRRSIDLRLSVGGGEMARGEVLRVDLVNLPGTEVAVAKRAGVGAALGVGAAALVSAVIGEGEDVAAVGRAAARRGGDRRRGRRARGTRRAPAPAGVSGRGSGTLARPVRSAASRLRLRPSYFAARRKASEVGKLRSREDVSEPRRHERDRAGLHVGDVVPWNPRVHSGHGRQHDLVRSVGRSTPLCRTPDLVCTTADS